MIRISVTDEELQEMIDRTKFGWFDRADKRTKRLKTAGRYSENSSIWSEIKPAFMALQSNKCAYCERALAGIEAGKGEHDLEHYRPKGNVKKWPASGGELEYTFSTGVELENGYYWLAYDVMNYLTACGPCNRVRKSDHFPIAGRRGCQDNDVNALDEREKPLILFPIGSRDTDPQSVITFRGAIAIPKADLDEHNRNRARVTIDFFDLNGRDELLRDRFAVIETIWSQYDRLQTASNDRALDDAKAKIAKAMAPYSPHSSCALAYYKLCKTAPDKAWEFNQIAVKYVPSQGRNSTMI